MDNQVYETDNFSSEDKGHLLLPIVRQAVSKGIPLVVKWSHRIILKLYMKYN